jgi:hypothetical protein
LADSTIIISGPARSGTSLIAAIAHAGGLWLGDQLDKVMFADQEFVRAINPHPQLMRRLMIAARNIGDPGLMLRGVDSTELRRLIANRNERFQKWGFKLPNVVAQLGDSDFRLFRNPRLILVFRDPIAVAGRIAVSNRLPFMDAVNSAQRQFQANIKAIRRLKIPTLTLSHAKATADFDTLCDTIFDFCGLTCSQEHYADIRTFVAAAGAEYKRLMNGPVYGYVDEYRDGALTGWCRLPKNNDAVSVDIVISGTRVTTVRADIYRQDLYELGFGTGRHGFRAELPLTAVDPNASVQAVVTGTGYTLENSGRLLSELSAPSA